MVKVIQDMSKNKKTIKAAKNDNAEGSPPPQSKAPDPVELSRALMDAHKRAQPILQDLLNRYGSNAPSDLNLDPLNVGTAYLDFIQQYWADPQKAIDIQTDYWQKSMQLWQASLLKFWGGTADPIVSPDKGDRRFKASEWDESAMFDFIKQSYLLTCNLMNDTVHKTQGLDEKKKEKLLFSTKLFADALSPTNFLMTNPEVIKETLATGGGNLVRGLENLLEDLERGKGELKISTTDYKAFELGRNIATTPGRVVYQNDLMQLIQYEPTTEKVFARPLLIISPWINKYYILDLREDNSFIKWAVDQGHTVFVTSWVNPDAKLAQKRFEDYMKDGIIAALDQIKKITDEPDCNVVGYCLGGTLLTITMAYLAAQKQENRIASATFLTTLIDFENSGEMKLFMDDDQLKEMDKSMAEHGVLEGKQLQQTFSLLRANDLIWSFVVNNYLMGKEPFPFDLLYWNDDSTNMPAAMHSFYLRKLYRDNLLCKPGGISMYSTPIDVRKIKTPSYYLSTREDHIAPWKATYATTQLTSGPKTFTLAASGHIAGIVNSPVKKKYCYWSAENTPADPEKWLESAQEQKGSWWPHWQKWIKAHGGKKIEARKPAPGIEAAPGSYVKVRNT